MKKCYYVGDNCPVREGKKDPEVILLFEKGGGSFPVGGVSLLPLSEGGRTMNHWGGAVLPYHESNVYVSKDDHHISRYRVITHIVRCSGMVLSFPEEIFRI